MLLKIENKEQLRELIKNTSSGTKKIQWINEKNEIVQKRIAISTFGSLMIMWEKSRRRGMQYESEITELIQKGILYFVLPNKKEKNMTAAEKYISELKKWEKAVEKKHPNVWNDLLTKKLTPEKEAILLNDANIKSHFDAWKKAGDIGLNRISKYKTTTLDAWRIPEYHKAEIKKALDNKGKYSCSWRYKYDCSVEVNATEEVQRAWFSLEYKDCGNGHYYLLLNDNLAIFAEDD